MTHCPTCISSMAVLHRKAGGVAGVPQVGVDHFAAGRRHHPPRLHQVGDTEAVKVMKMLPCRMYHHFWFTLTLWMVATKRRMAAARWKRMMKAKTINMAAPSVRSGQRDICCGKCLSLCRAFQLSVDVLLVCLCWLSHRLVVWGGSRSFTWKESAGSDIYVIL